MIEINLLPPQYRAVERTPLPVFLSVIAGIALIGGAFVGLMFMLKGVQEKRETKDQRIATAEKKSKEAALVDQLKKDIEDAQKRVDTVIGIAESKVYWGLKLFQLTRLIPDNVWLDQLTITQKDDGSGELRMLCNSKGTGFDKFTEFKQKLRSDTNFFYHFDSVDAPVINVVKAGKEYYDAEYLQFTMSLPIKKVELGGPKRN
jgi:hypothetical protein